MLNQLIRAGRLDRSFYTSLLFDDYATGNAVAIIVLIFAVPTLIESVNIAATGGAALGSLVRGGLSAIAAWAVATRVIGRDGRIPTTFRLVGFAHVAFIPLMITPWVSTSFDTALLLVSLGWYFLGVRVVAAVQFDLGDGETWQVALGAVGAWFFLAVFPLF